jgi:hypothetical protein
MALERIAAIGYATPVRNPVGSTGRRPTMGETIELTFDAAAADELLATTAEGVQLKLAGLGTLGRDLTAGDVLLVKVLATSPRLELALFDTAPRAMNGTAGRTNLYAFETEQAAMRPDQVAWLRQVVWRPPDASALAASWRAALLGQLERQATWQGRVPGRDVTMMSPQTDADPAPPHGDPFANAVAVGTSLPKTPTSTDPWMLAAYAWGGMRVLLRVLAADAEGGSSPHKRQGAPLALRVTLILPGLGRVTVQLQFAPGGVWLDLAVERADALQPLRDRLPSIVAAIGRADLRVLRCRLMRGVPGGTTPHPSMMPSPAPQEGHAGSARPAAAPNAGAVLAPALFRAAAEIVAVLSAPAPPAASAVAALPPPQATANF